MKGWVVGLVVVVLVSVLLSCTGCVVLTPDQKARKEAAEARLEEAKKLAIDAAATVEQLFAESKVIAAKIVQVDEDVKEGKIPEESGRELVAVFQDKQKRIQELIVKGQQQVADATREAVAATAELKQLRAEGIPVWYLVLSAGLNLAGAGGAARLLGKFRTIRSAFGAVSRAGNTFGQEFADKVAEEIEAKKGLSNDKVQPLHHLATAREI